MGVLYLSYENLPSHLKQCFIFCSLHPEDYLFMRHTLIQYWVASGFVKKKNGMIMEEVANEYYDELLRRNLLQTSDPHYYRQGACTMHDLLRALAQFITQGEYFSGDVAKLASTTSSASQEMKLRHLSIFMTDTSWPETLKGQRSLRTLLFFSYIETRMVIHEDLFQNLKCLSVLDFSISNLDNVPESISSLVHLRYIDFSDSMISQLPESIGNLSNLQYLILQRCKQLSELPKSIANLYKLRSIDLLHTPVIGVPRGIGGLVDLNRVVDFVTNEITADGSGECYSSLEEIKSLLQLRKISIKNLERASCRAQGYILTDKTQIHNLQLSCSSDGWQYQEQDAARIQDVFEQRLVPPRSVEEFKINGYFGLKLPTWMNNINLFFNLTKLQILKCRSCSQLPPLGLLPLLDFLIIEGASSIQYIGPEFMGNESVAFPKLMTFALIDMQGWEEWIWNPINGARVMPVLESLIILNCPLLKYLPLGLLYHATNLTSLRIEESQSLTFIGGFQTVKTVSLSGNNAMQMVSDLPKVQTMRIIDCPGFLRNVGKLPSLETLDWEDSSMRFLPNWMIPYPVPILPTLQRIFIIVGDVLTLRRCLEYGPDWPKIEHIPNVFTGVMNRPEFISYTKETRSFFTNISEVVDAPPPPPGYESGYRKYGYSNE